MTDQPEPQSINLLEVLLDLQARVTALEASANA